MSTRHLKSRIARLYAAAAKIRNPEVAGYDQHFVEQLKSMLGSILPPSIADAWIDQELIGDGGTADDELAFLKFYCDRVH
ncbi:MAG: hypothetical protein WCJ35_28705 [Planctomycetota bacterium]